MTQYNNIRTDSFGRFRPVIDHLNTVIQRGGGFRPDITAGGQTHMRHEDIRTGSGHGNGIFTAEDIRCGQQIFFMCLADHLHFQRITHAGFFQIGAEFTVDQADCREVLHAGKPGGFDIVQEFIKLTERIRAVDTRQNRRMFHDRQHFFCHIHDDFVGITVSQQTGQ